MADVLKIEFDSTRGKHLLEGEVKDANRQLENYHLEIIETRDPLVFEVEVINDNEDVYPFVRFDDGDIKIDIPNFKNLELADFNKFYSTVMNVANMEIMEIARFVQSVKSINDFLSY